MQTTDMGEVRDLNDFAAKARDWLAKLIVEHGAATRHQFLFSLADGSKITVIWDAPAQPTRRQRRKRKP